MEELIESIVASGRVAMVDFYAEWCGPCKVMAPTLEKVSADTENVELVKVDIDKHMDLATEYNVRSVPTVVFLFKDKKQSLIGTANANDVLAIIDDVIGSASEEAKETEETEETE